MPTSTFEGLADPPLSIERWNPASRMLQRVSVEVWLQTCNVCISHSQWVTNTDVSSHRSIQHFSLPIV